MDARQLEYFVAIVEAEGFNRAAQRLHVAQPSLSQAIRALERDLGVALFHRVGRRAVLTDAGQAMIEPARRVLRDLGAARSTVDSVRELRAGRVDIASMPSQSVEPLATQVARFQERCPGVVVVVQPVFTAPDAMDAVRSGKAELGLIGAAEDLAMPGLTAYPMSTHRFVLVTPPESPFRGRGVRHDDLAGQRVITSPPGSRMRHVVDAIQAEGVDLHIAVETAHREAILPLVLKGVGIAVLTEAWAPLARRAGALVFDLEPSSSLRVSLVHRPAPLTPAAQSFLDTALEVIGNSYLPDRNSVLDTPGPSDVG